MDREGPKRGWTIGRIVGLIIAVVAMAGLGFGSACGLILAAALPEPRPWILVGVVGGVILFVLFLKLAITINRRAEGRKGDLI